MGPSSMHHSTCLFDILQAFLLSKVSGHLRVMHRLKVDHNPRGETRMNPSWFRIVCVRHRLIGHTETEIFNSLIEYYTYDPSESSLQTF